MLHIFLCTDRKENTAQMLREVCHQASLGKEGLLIVVPEQFSHMTERALCCAGGDSISRYGEVLGFSRLASRVFAETGGAADTDTDRVGQLLTISLAVEQVRSRLKLYASSVAKPEFLLRLLDTFEEFRGWCVTPDALRKAAGGLGGALAVKLEEFALLMESYDAACADLGQNPDSRLTRLLSALEGGEFARGKQFFFDAFTDFNGIEREILAQLLADGAPVWVYLSCDGLEGRGQQFAAARRTAQTLVSLAKQQEIPWEVTQIPAPEAATAPAYLRRHLFGGRCAPWTQLQQEVRFISGSDSTQMCRAAVGQLLQLQAEGFRWRDITLACTDYESLRPVLSTLLRRGEIPAYFAGDSDLLRQGVVHMLLDALASATGGMGQEEVLSCLKSGYLPLDREACDQLENYVHLWSIDGNRFAQEWTMNPAGFGRSSDQRWEETLAQINRSREVGLRPLLCLREGIRAAKTTGQMILALHGFMEEIELCQQLTERAEACFSQGKHQQAQELAQVYDSICALLEQIYGVLGHTVRTGDGFLQMLRTALRCCTIGTIPATLDCVSVGSLMSQRRSDTEVLILLGAQEGLFPAAASDTSLLTDEERAGLLHMGISLNPTAAGRLDRELAAIDSVLAVPRRLMYLAAPEGKEAYFLRRAQALVPQAPVISDDSELIARCPREFESRAGDSPRLQAASNYAIGELSPTGVEALYGKTLRLSSSKIDTLASCKFRYFLQYGLRAQEHQPAEMNASLYGTFVHDVLEHTARQVVREGGFHQVPLTRVEEIAENRMELLTRTMLADLWESTRAEYLFRRTFQEVGEVVRDLYHELSQSAFEPKWFELNFSADGMLPAVRIVSQNITAELEGYVDRADLWQCGDRVYVRVVDYKTGKKAFDYTNILNGLGLQMLLYLFALEEYGARLQGGGLTSAGVLYFPARVEKSTVPQRLDAAAMEKRRQQATRRSGLLLDEAPVLQAMEPCDQEPRYLPYQIGKDGQRKGTLADRQQFAQLATYVRRTVADLADTLACGIVRPDPYFRDSVDNACAWCPYEGVCRGKKEPRWLEKVTNGEQFWEKVVERNG